MKKRHLFEEAVSLSEIVEPKVYSDQKVTYRVWDHTITGQWDGYKDSARVIKTEESKTLRHHSKNLRKCEYIQEKADWLWVTKLPSVVSLKNVVSICHCRW